MALHELSKALPESLRPLPPHLVEVADNNTAALPNTGIDAGQYAHPSQLALALVSIGARM